MTEKGQLSPFQGGPPDVAFARESLPWWAPAGVWLASWIDAGRLKPIVHRTYPLAEFRDAFAELERPRGKVVVTI